MVAKQEVIDFISAIPGDDIDIEEALYRFYVREEVKCGKQDVDAGHTLSSAEVRSRLQKWLQ